MERVINILINEVFQPLIFLFFGIAVVIFLSGIVVYVANADNDEKRKKGTKQIGYGIIGFVIMTGAWGILKFFDRTIQILDPDTETTLDTYLENQGDTSNN